MKKITLLFLFAVPFLIHSCDKSPAEEIPGNITFHFKHRIEGKNIEVDQLKYLNAAGNQYEVSEIQWFISDVTLVAEDGEEILLSKDGFAHYIDTDREETQVWAITQKIKPENYTSVKMTFGIKGEKNIPYSFPNPPESDMIWPYHMGGDNGGYHYMKLNGFWINADDARTPFNFHIGVGQEYDGEGNVTAFIQNWFEKTLPDSGFELHSGETKDIYLIMNVENWFQNPHTYDHNLYGGKIMMNQEAMGKIRDNGVDVFSVEFEDRECISCGPL